MARTEGPSEAPYKLLPGKPGSAPGCVCVCDTGSPPPPPRPPSPSAARPAPGQDARVAQPTAPNTNLLQPQEAEQKPASRLLGRIWFQIRGLGCPSSCRGDPLNESIQASAPNQGAHRQAPRRQRGVHELRPRCPGRFRRKQTLCREPGSGLHSPAPPASDRCPFKVVPRVAVPHGSISGCWGAGRRGAVSGRSE